MPTRWVCLTLLGFWTFAAWELFRRDILPDLIVGPPPDLRAISQAASEGPVRWLILLGEEQEPAAGQSPTRRAIGQVVTETVHQRDGGVRLTSQAWFDAAQLLRRNGGPTAVSAATRATDWLLGRSSPTEAAQDTPPPELSLDGERIEVYGNCWIDRTGDLEGFRIAVREGRMAQEDLIVLDGRLRKDRIVITPSGPIPYIGPLSFPYPRHGMVQTGLAPLDRLPGLHVGQKWQTHVISPLSLTGQVVAGNVEVVGKKIFTWDGNPVTTLEVVSRVGGLTARTWVRPDGLVLRQEVPLPTAKLLLERVPNAPTIPAMRPTP